MDSDAIAPKTFAEAVESSSPAANSSKIDLKSLDLQDIPLPLRQTHVKNSKPAVLFTPLELQRSEVPMQFSLVAKFSRGRPRMESIRDHINKNWELSTPPIVGMINQRHVFIKLHNSDDFYKAWTRNTHEMEGALFRLFKWTMNFSLSQESSIAPVWIKLPLLPLNFCVLSYLRAITQPIGKFLAADLPTLSKARPAYARVCVEIDLCTKIEERIWIGPSLDAGFWQEIEYERYPQYCTKCFLQGHTNVECRKNFVAQRFTPDYYPQKTVNKEEHKLPNTTQKRVAQDSGKQVPNAPKANGPTDENFDHDNVKKSVAEQPKKHHPVVFKPAQTYVPKKKASPPPDSTIPQASESAKKALDVDIAGKADSNASLILGKNDDLVLDKDKDAYEDPNPKLPLVVDPKIATNNFSTAPSVVPGDENTNELPLSNSFSSLEDSGNEGDLPSEIINATPVKSTKKKNKKKKKKSSNTVGPSTYVAPHFSQQNVVSNNTIGSLMQGLHLDSSTSIKDDEDSDFGLDFNSDPDIVASEKLLKGKYRDIKPFNMTTRGYRVRVKF